MKRRCAAYARYSSDRQSPASIEDQLRKCREYAQQKDLEVLDEHVYVDEAVSGAGADRPGLKKLLEAVNSSPRPFDVLLMDDTSRLFRNLGDSMKFNEKLKFLGIRVVSVSQGIDTQNDEADVLFTVHGLVDSLYIKELAKKTHRGLEGRVLKGEHAGGRCFGYDNVRTGDSVQQQVNEAEAAVVRRIFEMAAAGGSLKTITKTLNGEHVPPPRKRAKKRDGTWCHNAIREMLRNEHYIGRLIWNRSKYIKQPDTNKRLRRMRPKSEWIVVEKPELRIIEDALWQRVQDRIAFVGKYYNFGNRPGLAPRAFTSPNLLTGFMQCGVCGANLIIVSGLGKSGYPSYGCPQNSNRGACSNGLKQRADQIQDHLFSKLQDAVLQPEAVEFAVQDFERQLQSSLLDLDNKIGRMRQRSEQLKHELGNLASTAALCGPTPALVKDINVRQQELDDISRQLLSAEPDSVSAEIGRIRQFVTGRLDSIRHLLKTDVRKAKAELEKHVAGIRMVPQLDGKKGHYIAEGEWNLVGGYTEGAGSTTGSLSDGCGGWI